jgi:hypothetical protein
MASTCARRGHVVYPITHDQPLITRVKEECVTLTPRTAPHGTWRSPITADLITGRRVGLANPRCDGDVVYWIESRGGGGGRAGGGGGGGSGQTARRQTRW